jgi:hypothetical protein
MNLQRIPIAVELFAQWRRARGGRAGEPRSRPFSRSWDDLLEDAGILSAQEHNDALRDARELQASGFIELKPVRYKPHLIERISIPLGVEARWMEAFHFTPPDDSELRQIEVFPWQPELQFVREARLNLSFAELQQLNQFFASGGRILRPVPIKERSLEIFGDEKRLDLLYSSSSLFQDTRLSLEHLRCFIVPEPLGWKRGCNPDGPMIILENAATWHSFAEWDRQQPQFSATIYGGGKRIIHSVAFLGDIFSEVGGRRPLYYFGDLDAAGLQIARLASDRSAAFGFGSIAPHTWSYTQLFELAASKPITQPTDQQQPRPADLAWLGPLQSTAQSILERNQRIPQEWIGIEFLLKSIPAV